MLTQEVAASTAFRRMGMTIDFPDADTITRDEYLSLHCYPCTIKLLVQDIDLSARNDVGLELPLNISCFMLICPEQG